MKYYVRLKSDWGYNWVKVYGKTQLQLQNMEVKLLKHYQKRLPDKKLLQYKLKELA